VPGFRVPQRGKIHKRERADPIPGRLLGSMLNAERHLGVMAMDEDKSSALALLATDMFNLP
jgi:hypothetical protein